MKWNFSCWGQTNEEETVATETNPFALPPCRAGSSLLYPRGLRNIRCAVGRYYRTSLLIISLNLYSHYIKKILRPFIQYIQCNQSWCFNILSTRGQATQFAASKICNFFVVFMKFCPLLSKLFPAQVVAGWLVDDHRYIDTNTDIYTLYKYKKSFFMVKNIYNLENVRYIF